MLDARQKAVLDHYYRIISGKVPAADIDGTLSEGNLPSSVTGDIGTSRLVDGCVTMAKLGSDVTMVKNIQRGEFVGTGGVAGWQTNASLTLATAVDLTKAVLIISGAVQVESGDMKPTIACRLKSDGTAIEYESMGEYDTTIEWQVIEFI